MAEAGGREEAMAAEEPVTVICQYRVREGKEEAFVRLLRRHWPTLADLGVVTDEAARAYRGADEKGRPVYYEIFSWRSESAFERAHSHPDVLAIWEPMDALCEARDGRPNMEFPHVQGLAL
jgi:quinol monooxygenase YgiN